MVKIEKTLDTPYFRTYSYRHFGSPPCANLRNPNLDASGPYRLTISPYLVRATISPDCPDCTWEELEGVLFALFAEAYGCDVSELEVSIVA